MGIELTIEDNTIIFEFNGKNYSIKTGSTFSFNGGSHAFAITNITSSTVKFINPTDSSREYTVTWEQFITLCAEKIETVYF